MQAKAATRSASCHGKVGAAGWTHRRAVPRRAATFFFGGGGGREEGDGWTPGWDDRDRPACDGVQGVCVPILVCTAHRVGCALASCFGCERLSHVHFAGRGVGGALGPLLFADWLGRSRPFVSTREHTPVGSAGRFVVDPYKVVHFIVPNLTDCKVWSHANVCGVAVPAAAFCCLCAAVRVLVSPRRATPRRHLRA